MKPSKIIKQISSLDEKSLNLLKENLQLVGLSLTGSINLNLKTSKKGKTFSVKLTNIGSSKLNLVKFLKSELDLSLIESKDLAESFPCILKTFTSKVEASLFKTQIDLNGGTCEIV